MDLEVLSRLIEKHEGRRLKPYRDSVGKLTIGCGRNLDDLGISNAEADFLLKSDMVRVIEELNRLLPWWVALSDARRMVLVDMGFNLGVQGLLKFNRMIGALRNDDFRTAAAEMLSSQWASQVGARADELAGMMIKG